MSDLLDSRLTPEQLQECVKNDALMGIKTAHGIKTSTEMFRAGGNHRSADNDEPSLEAADIAEDVNKSARRHAINDSGAFAEQMKYLDAIRGAGL